MHKIIILLVSLFAVNAFADSFSVSVVNKVASTNSTVYSTAQGKLNAIVIDVTGTTTGTLTVTSGRTGETILTKTVSADAVARPRFNCENSSGVALSGVSNQVEKFYLSSDTLTFSLTETAPVTNSYTITVITEKAE